DSDAAVAQMEVVQKIAADGCGGLEAGTELCVGRSERRVGQQGELEVPRLLQLRLAEVEQRRDIELHGRGLQDTGSAGTPSTAECSWHDNRSARAMGR